MSYISSILCCCILILSINTTILASPTNQDFSKGCADPNSFNAFTLNQVTSKNGVTQPPSSVTISSKGCIAFLASPYFQYQKPNSYAFQSANTPGNISDLLNATNLQGYDIKGPSGTSSLLSINNNNFADALCNSFAFGQFYMNLGGQPSDPKALKNLMAKKLGITGTTINQANYFKSYVIMTNIGDNKNEIAIPNFYITASNKTSLPYYFIHLDATVNNYPQLSYYNFINFNGFIDHLHLTNIASTDYRRWVLFGSASGFTNINENFNCTNLSTSHKDTTINIYYNIVRQRIPNCYSAPTAREAAILCMEPQNYP